VADRHLAGVGGWRLKMQICALLIGKHNSGSVPGKNYVSVLGRPLCAYPMMAAMHCHRIERLLVPTGFTYIWEAMKISFVGITVTDDVAQIANVTG